MPTSHIQIETPRNYSLFSPSTSNACVYRKQQIETIYLYLNESQVVLVEGKDGIGKTTILSQILDDNRYETISLFLDEINAKKISDKQVYKDIYIQCRVLMGSFSEDDIDKDVTWENLLSTLSTLEYWVKAKKKNILFILDGFDDLYNFEENVVSEIMFNLPSSKGIKYVISTGSQSLSDKIIIKNKRTFSVSVMSSSEVQEMIPSINAHEIDTILKSFGGLPDKLAIISRLISGGVDVSDILLYESSETEGLYEKEWECNVKNDLYESVVAFVAFSDKGLSIDELSICVDSKVELISNIITNISFLEEKCERINFVSPGFKEYITQRLSDKKLTFTQSIIGLINSKKIASTRETLSFYYKSAGDNEALLHHIDDKYIIDSFNENNSLNDLLKNINLALDISNQESKEASLIKFSHLKCMLSNIGYSQAIIDEINRYLVENDYKSALDLIDSIKSKEDRLQSYAIYAIHHKSSGIEIPCEIEDKIKHLFSHINVDNLGARKSIDIAADLFPVYPELSMKIVNEIDTKNASGQNKSDFAFLRLSLEALKRHGESLSEDLDEFEGLDEKRSTMLQTLKLFNPDSPVEKVFEHIDTMENSGDKIFLLRAWLIRYHSNSNALIILDKLLDIILDSIDFSADASIYHDISKCLEFETSEISRNVYHKLSYQVSNLREKGPTIDYCKLELILSSYEKVNEINSTRLDDLVRYVTSFDDLSIRLTCFCIIGKCVGANSLEIEINDIELEKQRLFCEIKDSAALHIDVFKEVLQHEAIINIDNANLWAGMLNTEPRRDKAKSIIIKSLVKNYSDIAFEIKFNKVLSLAREIKDNVYRDKIFKYVVRAFDEIGVYKSEFEQCMKFIGRLENNFVKVRSYISVLKIAFDKGIISEIESRHIEKITSSLDKIEGDWHRIELCFYVSEKLFNINRELSDYFKNKAIDIRCGNYILDKTVVQNISASSDLAVRCIHVLSKYGLDTTDDLDSSLEVINIVSSELVKLNQLSRLASVYQKGDSMDKLKVIIEKYIIPTLDSFSDRKTKEYSIACEICLPIVFRYNENLFEQYYNDIDRRNVYSKDSVIANSIKYIYNDVILNDPFEPLKTHDYKLTYSDLLSVVNLIELINDDSFLMVELYSLFDKIQSMKKKNKISKAQMIHLISTIENGILPTLPRDKYIQHHGYVILLQSLIQSLKDKDDVGAWNRIVNRARQIKCDSDCAYTLSEIAKHLPDRSSALKTELYKESETKIDEMKITSEKVSRYRQLCQNQKDFDKNGAKKTIKKAVLISSRADMSSSQARLNAIDLAHKFGGSFSGSLSSMFDDDPARKKMIEEQINQRKLEDEEKGKFEKNLLDSAGESSLKFSELAWDNLGTLNASSGHFSKGFNVSDVMYSLSGEEFDKLYKIFSFYIHYIEKVHPGKENAQNKIRPIFDALISNLRVFKGLYHDHVDLNCDVSNENDNNLVVISENDHEVASDFIKGWFSDARSNSLIVIDPYFDIEDFVEISKAIDRDPEVKITILSSLEQRKKIISEHNCDIDEIVADFWVENISKSAHPEVEFIFAGYGGNNKLPIHDRWWLTNDSGIHLGTSIGGLANRISQISTLGIDGTAKVFEKVNPFLKREMKFYQDQKLKYKVETI